MCHDDACSHAEQHVAHAASQAAELLMHFFEGV